MAASRLVQTSRGFASLLFDSIRFDSPEAASNAFIGVRFRAGHSRCKKLLPRKEKRNRTAIGDYVHTMRSPTDLATRFVFFPFLFFFSFFFFFFFFLRSRKTLARLARCLPLGYRRDIDHGTQTVVGTSTTRYLKQIVRFKERGHDRTLRNEYKCYPVPSWRVTKFIKSLRGREPRVEPRP